MKWLVMAISFLLAKQGGVKAPPGFYLIEEKLAARLAEKARAAAGLLITAYVFAQFFVAGGVIAFVNITNQYDSFGQVLPTATLWAAILMMLASIIVLAGLFSIRPKTSKSAATKEDSPEGRPIERGISALISDFTKQREHNRQIEMLKWQQQSRDAVTSSSSSVGNVVRPNFVASTPSSSL